MNGSFSVPFFGFCPISELCNICTDYILKKIVDLKNLVTLLNDTENIQVKNFL